jgi:hypothetical protein
MVLDALRPPPASLSSCFIATSALATKPTDPTRNDASFTSRRNRLHPQRAISPRFDETPTQALSLSAKKALTSRSSFAATSVSKRGKYARNVDARPFESFRTLP